MFKSAKGVNQIDWEKLFKVYDKDGDGKVINYNYKLTFG